jgi:hypothetical protein
MTRPGLTALAALGLLAAASTFDSVQADPYPWCADQRGDQGGTNCGFVTLEQCRATVSGIGGYCVPNPFYDGIPFNGQPRPRRR